MELGGVGWRVSETFTTVVWNREDRRGQFGVQRLDESEDQGEREEEHTVLRTTTVVLIPLIPI